MRGKPTDFLDRTFAAKSPPPGESVAGNDLVETVLAGGYREALRGSAWNRRLIWHMSYFDAIMQRDIPDIAGIDKLQSLSKLLRVLAEHSAQLPNYSAFGAPLALNHVTTREYLNVLENLFLVRNLQPWYTNAIKRVTKRRKRHFLDSGLLAALKGISPDRPRRDRTQFGSLLRTFVFAELMKIANWSENHNAFSHFRDKEDNEVAFIIVNHGGRVIGVEIEASATVTSPGFSGSRRLAVGAGDRFAFGIVLYDHHQIVRFAEQMAAVPISALW